LLEYLAERRATLRAGERERSRDSLARPCPERNQQRVVLMLQPVVRRDDTPVGIDDLDAEVAHVGARGFDELR
jgi:hypothetical protein